jgi:hypothetical protein
VIEYVAPVPVVIVTCAWCSSRSGVIATVAALAAAAR